MGGMQMAGNRQEWVARSMFGVVAFFGLVLGLACTSTTLPPADDEPVVADVAIEGFAFAPKEITVKQGTVVRWTNLETDSSHTVTSGDPDTELGSLFDSGTLSPGDPPFERSFDDVGEFEYCCRFHNDRDAMRHAKVIVEAP